MNRVGDGHGWFEGTVRQTPGRALPGPLPRFVHNFFFFFPEKRYECVVPSLGFVVPAAYKGVCNYGSKARSLGSGQHVFLFFFSSLPMEYLVRKGVESSVDAGGTYAWRADRKSVV